MVYLPKRSLLFLSLVVLLEIAWVSAHAQMTIEGDQNPQAALAKRAVNHKALGAQQDFARSHSSSSIKKRSEPEKTTKGSQDEDSTPKEIPADYRFARPMAWKRSTSGDSTAKSRYARPMAWKTKRAVGGVPESGLLAEAAPSTRKEKRAVGSVPDSGPAALDMLKPARRASVLKKRKEGTVDLPPPKSSSQSGRRLVARENFT